MGNIIFSSSKETSNDHFEFISRKNFADEKLCEIIGNINKLVGFEEHNFFIIQKFIINRKELLFEIINNGEEEYCGYSITQQIDLATARLVFIAIDPSQQGKGLGSSSLLHTIAKIKTLGFSGLELDSSTQNMEFYKKFAKKNEIPFTHEESLCLNGETKHRIKYLF